MRHEEIEKWLIGKTIKSIKWKSINGVMGIEEIKFTDNSVIDFGNMTDEKAIKYFNHLKGKKTL